MGSVFRLLGRLNVDHDGRPVPLGRRRERCLLGVLLLEAGAVVPVDRLVDLLWDGAPPPTARAYLYTHMARLRASLAPVSNAVQLRNVDCGYVAEVDKSTVDAHRFRALAHRASAAADARERAALARQALALWRGPVLADAPDRLRERVTATLTELRLATAALLNDAELAAGRHHELIGEVTLLAAEHPHHERFAAQLMLALYRSGRQADALHAFQRARAQLAEQLGIEPGPDLRTLYTAILRGDPALTAATPA